MRTFVLHRWSEFWFTIHPNTWIVNGKMKEIFRNMDIFSYMAYIIGEYMNIYILAGENIRSQGAAPTKRLPLELLKERRNDVN